MSRLSYAQTRPRQIATDAEMVDHGSRRLLITIWPETKGDQPLVVPCLYLAHEAKSRDSRSVL